jgi:hypothetical protein
MQLIAHQELTSAAASITFSSIPQTFTDLVIKFSLRNSVAAGAGTITFNTSGGTYTRRRLQGNGSSAFSDSPSFDYVCGLSSFTASTFGNGEIYISNYRSSVAKSYSSDSVNENNAIEAFQTLIAGLWSGTDAVTTITLTPLSGGNWVQYSSATLYGITAGSDGIVAVS